MFPIHGEQIRHYLACYRQSCSIGIPFLLLPFIDQSQLRVLVPQMVQMKNRISGLLMETGVSHNQQRLHKVGYFRELMNRNKEIGQSIRPLLRLSRETVVRLQKTEYALASSLQRDPLLAARVQRLQTVPGWARLPR